MKNYTAASVFCCILLIFACSCTQKKKPAVPPVKKPAVSKTPVYFREGKAFGILRVECNDCRLIYTVGHQDFTVDIREGNEDRFIYPKHGSQVKARLQSHEKQMIRILAIDPNGKVVSNVLDGYKRNELRESTFEMKWLRGKNTVRINRDSLTK